MENDEGAVPCTWNPNDGTDFLGAPIIKIKRNREQKTEKADIHNQILYSRPS